MTGRRGGFQRGQTVRRMSHRAAVVAELAEGPWAIRPDVLDAIVSAVRAIAADDTQPDQPVEPKAAIRGGFAGGGAVAVVPVRGPITPRTTLFSLFFGGTSVEGLRRMIRGAVADDQVGSIVMDVDSPGGRVDGIPELAAEIRTARDRKPIVAVANADAASGAYWLASQANDLVVTPSGQVGSIGVFAAHTEFSAMDAQLGIKTTLVRAGKYKAETNPFEPLTDEARAHLQEMVDAYYGMFVADVAKGRDVKESAVREGFGQGRMVLARQAVSEGMADRVGTLDDAVARAARLASGGGGRRAEDSGGGPSAADPRLLRQPAVRDLLRSRLAASNGPASFRQTNDQATRR